jgi:hypothetical protein
MTKKRQLKKLVTLHDYEIKQLLREQILLDKEIKGKNLQLQEVKEALKLESQAIIPEVAIIDSTIFFSKTLEKIANLKLEIEKLNLAKEVLLQKILLANQDKEIKIKLLNKVEIEEQNLEAKQEQSNLDSLALDQLRRKK